MSFLSITGTWQWELSLCACRGFELSCFDSKPCAVSSFIGGMLQGRNVTVPNCEDLQKQLWYLYADQKLLEIPEISCWCYSSTKLDPEIIHRISPHDLVGTLAGVADCTDLLRLIECFQFTLTLASSPSWWTFPLQSAWEAAKIFLQEMRVCVSVRIHTTPAQITVPLLSCGAFGSVFKADHRLTNL